MKISIEISYYPLKDDYSNPVKEFIHSITDNSRVLTDQSIMSTIISCITTRVFATGTICH